MNHSLYVNVSPSRFIPVLSIIYPSSAPGSQGNCALSNTSDEVNEVRPHPGARHRLATPQSLSRSNRSPNLKHLEAPRLALGVPPKIPMSIWAPASILILWTFRESASIFPTGYIATVGRSFGKLQMTSVGSTPLADAKNVVNAVRSNSVTSKQDRVDVEIDVNLPRASKTTKAQMVTTQSRRSWPRTET